MCPRRLHRFNDDWKNQENDNKSCNTKITAENVNLFNNIKKILQRLLRLVTVH